MLKLMFKKQLMELFRNYVTDPRTNRARTKIQTILFAVLYAVLIIGVFGGGATTLSISMCEPMYTVGCGWLFFAIMSMLAVLLGVLGSVFATRAALYEAKDNDMLLSMPIPVIYIIISRLAATYLMGLIYTAVILVPAVVVYQTVAGVSAGGIICGVALIILISLLTLVLTVALGYAVARVGKRLKNKSFATVAISLAFICVYYFFYFKAQEFISEIIANAAVYGAAVKNNAYPVYIVGRVGEGDFGALAIVACVVLALVALTYWLISSSFLKIVTSSAGGASKKRGRQSLNQKGVSSALLSRELGRLTSSANYMLNCALGTIMLFVGGVALLIKGGMFIDVLYQAFRGSGAVVIILCGLVCAIAGLNDVVVPSVSLEGNTFWIVNTLPVRPRGLISAKLKMQLLITLIPALFCAGCAAVMLALAGTSALSIVLMLATVAAFVLLMATLGLTLGIKKANLNWTNEIVPIKQSMGVVVILLLGWLLSLGPIALYMLLFMDSDVNIMLAIMLAVYTCASVGLLKWLRSGGEKALVALQR